MKPSESLTPKIFAPCYMFIMISFVRYQIPMFGREKLDRVSKSTIFFLFFYKNDKNNCLCVHRARQSYE